MYESLQIAIQELDTEVALLKEEFSEFIREMLED